MWKIEGSAKKYATEAEARAAAGIEVVVEEIIYEVEEAIDPLEALRKARIERDGNIEEGSDNGSYNEDDFEEFSEGTD